MYFYFGLKFHISLFEILVLSQEKGILIEMFEVLVFIFHNLLLSFFIFLDFLSNKVLFPHYFCILIF